MQKRFKPRVGKRKGDVGRVRQGQERGLRFTKGRKRGCA